MFKHQKLVVLNFQPNFTIPAIAIYWGGSWFWQYLDAKVLLLEKARRSERYVGCVFGGAERDFTTQRMTPARLSDSIHQNGPETQKPSGLRISPNMERMWRFRDWEVAIFFWVCCGLWVWSRPLRRCWAHTRPWAVETAVQSFGTWEPLLLDVHCTI